MLDWQKCLGSLGFRTSHHFPLNELNLTLLNVRNGSKPAAVRAEQARPSQ